MKYGFNYTKNDIVCALEDLGIAQDDNVFIHSNLGFFGKLHDAEIGQDYYEVFKRAIFDVIGLHGTLIVPTFSYSFCKKQEYDPVITMSVCGVLSECLRKDVNAVRSEDANFSIAALGKNAHYFVQGASEYSFGQESFWHRFLNAHGKFLNFNFDSASTFIHYVERELKVPYRFDKLFQGVLLNNGKQEQKRFYHFCYDLNKKEHAPDFTKFDAKAKQCGYAKTVNLGKGQIVSISARQTFDLIAQEIQSDPNFLIRGL